MTKRNSEFLPQTDQPKVDVVEDQARLTANLKRQVQNACEHALQVSVDEESGLIKEFTDKAVNLHQTLVRDKILSLKKTKDQHLVFVENTHEYLVLIKLAMRQILKSLFNLSDLDLDSPRLQKKYAQWYAQNINRVTEHELREHYLGAMEHTNLRCFLGVEFYQTTNGKSHFRPVIDFDGEVPSDIFCEFVVKGADRPSQYDRIISG